MVGVMYREALSVVQSLVEVLVKYRAGQVHRSNTCTPGSVTYATFEGSLYA